LPERRRRKAATVASVGPLASPKKAEHDRHNGAGADGIYFIAVPMAFVRPWIAIVLYVANAGA
jgi:hypothetical protein